MRRRSVFASPFVVTVACGQPAPVAQPEPAAPIAAIPPDAAVPDAGDPPDAAFDTSLVGTVRFEDPACVRYEVDGARTRVDCTDDLLPAAPPGELVVAGDYGGCFRVYERDFRGRTSRRYWDEGRVRCPPNVKLPEKMVITIASERHKLDGETLTCWREIMSNPPHWKREPCLPELAPKLVGIEPDESCMYRGVQFNCLPDGASLAHPVTARIIGIKVEGSQTRVIIGRGTAAGLAIGMRVTIKGIPPFTLDQCNERTCSGLAKATEDRIKASGGTVTVGG